MKTEIAQIFPLKGLTQGHTQTVTITNAEGPCKLQFKHIDDTATWHDHPGFVGTVTGGVLVESFVCISASMRIRFDAMPTGAVSVSTVCGATATN